MTILSSRSTADLARGATVAVLAVVQVVVSGFGGSGVGAVARDYATPLLAASWTFGIWGVIYLGFLAYAGHQLLPAQRDRAVHRDTGWWLAASAVLNPAWILAFAARLIPLAQILVIALLVCLAVVLGRLSRVPAEGVVERVVFRGTVALYAGWVSLATILGAAATGVWAGFPGDGALAAIVVLLGAAAIVSWVVFAGTAVAPYAAAAVWALAGIALNGPPLPVAVAAAVAVAAIVAALVRRLRTAAHPARRAWG